MAMGQRMAKKQKHVLDADDQGMSQNQHVVFLV